MRFREIANRLTGLSTPLIGLQWTPATLDADVARKLIVRLEDRGVLYEPYSAEVPEHAVKSVEKIRDYLSDTLDQGGLADEFGLTLRAMRMACLKFMRTVCEDGNEPRIIVLGPREALAGGPQVWVFNQAIGELRGVIGTHLARIAVTYELDVPEPLSACLPLEPADARSG